MPTNQSVSLTKGSIPASTCFSSVSDLYDLFIGVTTAHVDGDYSLFNFGDIEPGVDDRTKPWIRTVSGKPDKMYVYQDGRWLSGHSIPASGGERKIWVGTENDLKTYDGGEDVAVTDYRGPFWEIDAAFAAKLPAGVGAFPSGAAVTVGVSSGEEETTLLDSQLPDHTHKGKAYYYAAGGGLSSDPSGKADNLKHEGSGHTTNASGTIAGAGVLTEGINGNSGEAHNNVPPILGVYFIKRTGRIYYTA